MNFYKKLDHYLLRHYPQIWIYRLHFFIPALLLMTAVATLVGYSIPMANFYAFKSDLSSSRSLLWLLSGIVGVLFFKRNMSFNRPRIHHQLPYNHTVQNFITYFAFFAFLILIPYLVDFIAVNKWLTKHIDTEMPDYYDSSFFLIFKPIFLRGVVLGALVLAVLLNVLCSANIGDFNKAILYLALSIPFYGVMLAFSKIFSVWNDDVMNIASLLIVLIYCFFIYLAFGSKASDSVKNPFAIVVHFGSVPFIMYLILWSTEKLKMFATLTGTGTWMVACVGLIMGFFAFNEVYKRRYIYPR